MEHCRDFISLRQCRIRNLSLSSSNQKPPEETIFGYVLESLIVFSAYRKGLHIIHRYQILTPSSPNSKLGAFCIAYEKLPYIMKQVHSVLGNSVVQHRQFQLPPIP